MKSPVNTHPNDGSAQLAKSTLDDALRAKRPQPAKADLSRANETHETPARTEQTHEADAARLFDAALTRSGVSSEEVSSLLGCSVSLVRRMRNPNARERVSFTQMLLLPPQFHIALIQELDGYFGLGRAMLARVQQAVGTLALLVR